MRQATGRDSVRGVRGRDEGVSRLNAGIGLALLCAAATQMGLLCKHRGAARAPRVDVRKPVRSVRALLRGLRVDAGDFVDGA